MKRTVIARLLPLVVSSLFGAGAVSSVNAAAPTGDCVHPVPVRSYTPDRLTYRLAVDLTDCAWWDHKPIELNAGLARMSADGNGDSDGASSLAWCEAVVTTESEDMSDEGDTGIRPGACSIEVSVQHPPMDTARYKGHITFPWEDGRRTFSFNAVCDATTDCVDLPVDPTTAPVPADDLPDAIGGEDLAG